MVLVLLDAVFVTAVVLWFWTRSDKMSHQEMQLFVIAAIMAIGNSLALLSAILGWLPISANGAF